MSKSSGDFLRLESLIEKDYNPLVFKYLLLMTHYRKELKFSFESVEAANNAYQKLLKKVNSLKEKSDSENLNLSSRALEYKNDFILAMQDDLNTSTALATLWQTLNAKDLTDEEKYSLLRIYDKYFGLKLS